MVFDNLIWGDFVKTVKIAVYKQFDCSGRDTLTAFVVPDDEKLDTYNERSAVEMKPRTSIGDWQVYLGTREYGLPEGYEIGLSQDDVPSICHDDWVCDVVAEQNGDGWNMVLIDHKLPRPRYLAVAKYENQVWEEATAQDV